MSGFLPITKKEMRERGITQFDFVYVIGRCLCGSPFLRPCHHQPCCWSPMATSVGIISQPDWKKPMRALRFSGSRGWASSCPAGNMDSMVNHYSVSKKRRSERCLYTRRRHGKDGRTMRLIGLRQPDPLGLIRTRLIIIGGIEASLRRLAHYDYWSRQAEAVRSCWIPRQI